MSKPSDKFLRLSRLLDDQSIDVVVRIDSDVIEAGPLYINVDNVDGWNNYEIRCKKGGLERVKESAEEIETEYNRATEAGEDE